MKYLEQEIRDLASKSDIAPESEVYQEVTLELRAFEPNLAFFQFETSGQSHYARNLGGINVTCPVLTLYLKYDADFQQTGIEHIGNWNDDWASTRSIRTAINAILRRRGFGNEYASDHTFIFVESLERIAFQYLGRDCKEAVANLIQAAVPGIEITHLFWDGGAYHAITRGKGDYNRVKKIKSKLIGSINALLTEADQNRYCRTYHALLNLGYGEMDLFHLMRESF